MNGLDILRSRLDHFIRRFYLFRLVKGSITWLGISLITIICFLALENWGQFASGTRTIMFWSYVVIFFLWLALRVFLPLAKMLKLVKGLSHNDAAEQLEQLEQGIKDRILNTLTLENPNLIEGSLADAAIKQKVKALESYEFESVINWKEVRSWLPLGLVPILALVALFSLDDGAFRESGKRLVYFDEEFLPPAPFSFNFGEDYYRVARGEGLEIALSLEGEEIPSEVLAYVNGVELLLKKRSGSSWLLKLNEIGSNVEVVFKANGYSSRHLKVVVFDRPKVGAFRLKLIPPAYTGLSPISNQLRSVHRFPEGSRFTIEMVGAESVSKALFREAGSTKAFEANEFFGLLEHSKEFDLVIQNEEDTVELYGGTRFVAIEDKSPSIRILSLDSVEQDRWKASLSYSDDYGVSKVQRIIKINDRLIVSDLVLENGRLLDELRLDSLINGEQLELYYRVWDNDGFNGSKYTDSRKLQLGVLSAEEIENKALQSLKSYAGSKAEKQKAIEEYDESLSGLQESLVTKKSLDWKDKEALRDQLTKLSKKREERIKEREALKEELNKLEADSIQKEELNKRLDEINKKEEDLRKLEEELKDLMEKLDMKDIKQKLEELRKENKEQQRREERMDDLLEDLTFQRDVLKEIEKLQEMSRELQKMSKEDVSKEELHEKKESFEESMEKLKELGDKKEALKEKLGEEQMKAAEQKVKEDLADATEKADSDSERKQQQSSESMEEASEEMQEMSESLSSMMMNMQANALKMNIESLRNILENLKRFSLDVEESGLGIGDLGRDDPAFRELLVEQRKLLSASEVIRDSLTVLAAKAPQIQDKVFSELRKMIEELDQAKAHLQEQDIAKATVGHQYSMMAANELALLLDNSLQSMMAMMAMQLPGNQNCEKPGGAKPKPGQMGKKASEIGQMVDKLQKGSKDGKGESGKSSKEIGRILSEQEALRQMIEKAEMGKEGTGNSKPEILEELDQMEDLLLDRNITEYRERFKRVESRLLEDERASEERKQKEERKSSVGNRQQMINGLEENDRLRKATSLDGFNRSQLSLVPFYSFLGSEQD